MKHKLSPWSIALPIVLVSALVLIGADAPGPSPDLSDADADAIPDALESAYFIDQNTPFHGLLDLDNDGLTTFQELTLYGTDPMFQDSDFRGQFDGQGPSINSYYIQFGAPWYWTMNGEFGEYVYPRNKGRLVETVRSEGGAFYTTFDPCAGRVVRKLGEGSTEAWWQSVAGASNEMQALYVFLNREALTDDVVCVVNLMDSAQVNSVQPALYVDLLAQDGRSVCENLYETNILAGTNEAAIVVLEIPTAFFSDAAIIRLRKGEEYLRGAGRNMGEADRGEVVVFEALVYEAADFRKIEQGAGLFGSGPSGGGGGSNTNWARIYETDYQGSNTNSPADPGGGNPPDDEDHSNPTGFIIIDPAKGSDSFNGRSATVMTGKTGPKKKIGGPNGGLKAADQDKAALLIIKSGVYKENLNISGKNLRVVISGNVKL